MSEDLFIRYCSPTLAGIKTGNLFSCPCPCPRALTQQLCGLNRTLGPKGVRILPLQVCGGRALIYAYRPHALEGDLTNQQCPGAAAGIWLCSRGRRRVCRPPDPPPAYRGAVPP